MLTKSEIEQRVERLERRLETGEYITKEDVDRPRGILTTADREYLIGEKAMSRQNEYNRRQAITERTSHGLRDLALLSMCPTDDFDFDISDGDCDRAIEFLEDVKQSD